MSLKKLAVCVLCPLLLIACGDEFVPGLPAPDMSALSDMPDDLAQGGDMAVEADQAGDMAVEADQEVDMVDLTIAAGKAVWDANSCAGCHGADGKGTESFPAASDLTSVEITSKPDAELKDSIKNGKGPNMPAYRSLTDEQLSNVVAYIRSL